MPTSTFTSRAVDEFAHNGELAQLAGAKCKYVCKGAGRQDDEQYVAARQHDNSKWHDGRRRALRIGAVAWMVASLAAALFVLRPTTPSPSGHMALASLEATTERPQRTKPIEQVRVGDRVFVGESYTKPDFTLGAKIDPATWKHVTMTITKPGGGTLHVELLRPKWWIDNYELNSSQPVSLETSELHIRGIVERVEVAPCPLTYSTLANVVTGTFRHGSSRVVDLYVEGIRLPIGVTDSHPIYCSEKHDFVAAGDIRPGHHVRTPQGDHKVLYARQAGESDVYNLEVGVHHVFHVTDRGILVHNAVACQYTNRYGLQGPPNTMVNGVHPNTGLPSQNAMFDANGDVVAHFDFHGPDPGHGHLFPPGQPRVGHGAGAPHLPPHQMPPGTTGAAVTTPLHPASSGSVNTSQF